MRYREERYLDYIFTHKYQTRATQRVGSMFMAPYCGTRLDVTEVILVASQACKCAQLISTILNMIVQRRPFCIPRLKLQTMFVAKTFSLTQLEASVRV